MTITAAAMPAAAFEAIVEMPAETAPPAVMPPAAVAAAPATPAPPRPRRPRRRHPAAPAPPKPGLATQSFFRNTSGPIG